jgi:hypothetical protein
MIGVECKNHAMPISLKKVKDVQKHLYDACALVVGNVRPVGHGYGPLSYCKALQIGKLGFQYGIAEVSMAGNLKSNVELQEIETAHVKNRLQRRIIDAASGAASLVQVTGNGFEEERGLAEAAVVASGSREVVQIDKTGWKDAEYIMNGSDDEGDEKVCSWEADGVPVLTLTLFVGTAASFGKGNGPAVRLGIRNGHCLEIGINVHAEMVDGVPFWKFMNESCVKVLGNCAAFTNESDRNVLHFSNAGLDLQGMVRGYSEMDRIQSVDGL